MVTQSGVYRLDFPGVTYTNALANFIYRADQAWRGGAVGAKVADVTAYVVGQDSMVFSFYLPDGANPDLLGLHWTMQCGNDVARDDAVPLPPALLLLGSGLLALAGTGLTKKIARK